MSKCIDLRTSTDPVTGERITPEEFHRRGLSGKTPDWAMEANARWEAREPAEPTTTKALHVIKDLEPYKSPETGEIIRSRRHHRDHLRAHGLIEVGNEKIRPHRYVPPPDPRHDLKRAFDERG